MDTSQGGMKVISTVWSFKCRLILAFQQHRAMSWYSLYFYSRMKVYKYANTHVSHPFARRLNEIMHPKLSPKLQ